MFYKMDQEQYNQSFEKMRTDMEKNSRQLIEILVCDFDRCLDLELSKEAKSDLIESLNDDFYTYLKSKINRKRKGKGPGNLSGKARATGKNELILNEIIKNDDNITITNNKGNVSIANGNSTINTSTNTTIIRKKKY